MIVVRVAWLFKIVGISVAFRTVVVLALGIVLVGVLAQVVLRVLLPFAEGDIGVVVVFAFNVIPVVAFNVIRIACNVIPVVVLAFSVRRKKLV